MQMVDLDSLTSRRVTQEWIHKYLLPISLGSLEQSFCSFSSTIGVGFLVGTNHRHDHHHLSLNVCKSSDWRNSVYRQVYFKLSCREHGHNLLGLAKQTNSLHFWFQQVTSIFSTLLEWWTHSLYRRRGMQKSGHKRLGSKCPR